MMSLPSTPEPQESLLLSPVSRSFMSKPFVLWLAGLVIVLNVLAVVGVVIGLMEFRQHEEDQASVHVRNQAEAIAQILDKNIDRIDNSLNTIARELERQLAANRFDADSVRQQITTQKALLGETESWSVIDAEGNVAFHEGYPVPQSLNLSERTYFQTLRDDPGQGLYVSRLLTSLLSGKPIIVFGRAYRGRDKRFAGAVVLTVPVSYFQSLLSWFEIGPNSLITVRDADMSLLAREPSSVQGQVFQLGDRRMSPELQHFMASAAPHTVYHATSVYDDVKRLFAVHRLANGQLFAAAGIAEDEYLADWDKVCGVAIVLLIVFLLATHMAAWMVYRFWRYLQHLAFYDGLTDLPNRSQFAAHLKQALALSAQRKETLAVCCLDIDNFHSINDVWGSEIGDQLLIQIARRLQAVMNGGEMVARVGGDEFIVLLCNVAGKAGINERLDAILAALSVPLRIEPMETELTVSLGVTVFPDDAWDADTLIRQADLTMYAAKQGGRNRCLFFDPVGEEQAREQRANYARLLEAVVKREFVLFYQPKVDLRSGDVVGAEALIRWNHPEHGIVPPIEFLPTIENSELSVTIGEWVIETALQQIGAWQKSGLALQVSVNIAPYHLQRPDFPGRLRHLLSAYPEVSPGSLQLEILETSAMADIEDATSAIERCKLLGVCFAIDDFGTGYSSLTYFRRLPAEVLKIDRSFVQDMLEDKNDLALVEGIIGLARIFGRKVVAEGVESVEHGISLIELGCDQAQGYGIARPMPAAQMPSWVAAWKPPSSWQTHSQDSET